MSLTKPLANYPHLRQVGDLYFLAGQGCRDPETNTCVGLKRHPADDKIIGYDIKEQTAGVLANIERALATAGLARGDLVDVTVFLTDMKDFSAMNEIWDQFFSACLAPPTRTTVAVKDLPGDNFIEMKALACKESK